jgi:hypothetical protein
VPAPLTFVALGALRFDLPGVLLLRARHARLLGRRCGMLLWLVAATLLFGVPSSLRLMACGRLLTLLAGLAGPRGVLRWRTLFGAPRSLRLATPGRLLSFFGRPAPRAAGSRSPVIRVGRDRRDRQRGQRAGSQHPDGRQAPIETRRQKLRGLAPHRRTEPIN